MIWWFCLQSTHTRHTDCDQWLVIFQFIMTSSSSYFEIIYRSTYLLLLVWHAPLVVRSAKRRHQSPEWTILSHSYCLIQWEIVWSQVLLDSLHPRGSRTSWWSPPVSEGEAVMILLASVSSGILAIWPNRERRRAWTIADRRRCPVVRLTSSFRTWWYHLIPNSFRRHHWLRASILSTSRSWLSWLISVNVPNLVTLCSENVWSLRN